MSQWIVRRKNGLPPSREPVCEPGVCPVCDTVVVEYPEYRFSFNLGLAVFLGKLFDAGGPVRTDDLGLEYSQRTNSQKLRYWGLAEQHVTEETARLRGWWRITEKGSAFVTDAIRIPRYAVTKRNVVLRLEGEWIAFKDVSEGYAYRSDYAEQARTYFAKNLIARRKEQS